MTLKFVKTEELVAMREVCSLTSKVAERDMLRSLRELEQSLRDIDAALQRLDERERAA